MEGNTSRVNYNHQYTINVRLGEQKLTLFALPFAHEEILSVRRHVEAQGEGEVGVDLLLHHGHHVKGVSHCVEAQDARQFLKAGPV